MWISPRSPRLCDINKNITGRFLQNIHALGELSTAGLVSPFGSDRTQPTAAPQLYGETALDANGVESLCTSKLWVSSIHGWKNW